jgi:hypothetical protein
MLAIVDFIRKNGLAEAIKEFKIKVKVYENKLHLKYDQIESNMSLKEVQECRGLILHKESLEVMSMSFFKFFNHGEGNAVTIDWETARILDKVDGSMMQVYWDPYDKKWYAATTGTAEGEGEVNNKSGTTFNELFWQTIDKHGFDISKLDIRFTYVFELTTPYNIVVKPHGESNVTLLTIRSNKTLEEFSYDNLVIMGNLLGVPLVKSYDLNANNFGDLIRTFEGMPWSEEGYVVVDANFNRVKIKNPAYCAVHHLKGKTAEHNILTIVKSNEIDEFAATFPERKDELYKLKANYDLLIEKLKDVWDELTPVKPTSPDGKKLFAATVFELCKKYKLDLFSGLFFSLESGKAASVNEYMLEYDDKKLYKIL